MPPNRRSLLVGTGVALSSLSGCLDALSPDPRMADLHLYNYTDTPQALKLEILDGDRTDGLVFARDFEVPPPQGETPAGRIRRPDVVRSRQYVVRVLLKNGRGQWRHHHFFPDSGTDDGSVVDVRVYRDRTTGELYVRFL